MKCPMWDWHATAYCNVKVYSDFWFFLKKLLLFLLYFPFNLLMLHRQLMLNMHDVLDFNDFIITD